MVPSQPTTALLLQMIEQNDEKHEAGHHRLRTDLRELADEMSTSTERLDRVEREQKELRQMAGSSLPESRNGGINAGRLIFPWQLLVVIVSGFLTAAGGMWSVTYGLRSDVRDILTKIQGQQEIEIQKAKLQDERYNALRESVQDMNRRVQLQQYEVQRLNETLAAMGRTMPRNR